MQKFSKKDSKLNSAIYEKGNTSGTSGWQIDGETGADFIFFGSKITADGDCRHEI